MAKKKVIGNCHICGVKAQLTFEHVPPRAAFNNLPVIYPPFEKLINIDHLDDIASLKGKQSQKGAGAYTLCNKCNNDTGAWYGDSFASWSHQAFHINGKIPPSKNHLYQFKIYPLKVLKQIICMFFSVNNSKFAEKNPELVQFVLNRELKQLNPKIRFYIYLNNSLLSRQSGITALSSFSTGKTKIFSELSFPPFGYIMSLDSPPPDNRLTDISCFSNYSYNEYITLSLRIPTFEIYSWVPGDFRNREEVLQES